MQNKLNEWAKETEFVPEEIPENIFLTGIESSDPFVEGIRRNELKEAFDFYLNYEKRLENISNAGIKWLRFGPPYSETHTGKENYNFSFSDKVIKKCQDLGITIIADLMHFGLPDWMHSANPDRPFFQNSDLCIEFSSYAKEFARRYPSIKYFTLVNEPFITAYFSANLGIWNEGKRGSSDEDVNFVIAVKNIAKAAICAKIQIENLWIEEKREGKPIFVQNESFELAIAKDNFSEDSARKFNIIKFVALDLIFGHRDKGSEDYLIRNGISKEDYEWFMKNGSRRRTILGIDHYPSCVHYFKKDEVYNCNPDDQYQLIALVKLYSERYKMLLLHTEINAWPNYALKICKETYDSLVSLRKEGYPILGMGWYGDEYQVGWHGALIGIRGKEESPVGLFYKGEIQPVGKLFSKLAKKGFIK